MKPALTLSDVSSFSCGMPNASVTSLRLGVTWISDGSSMPVTGSLTKLVAIVLYQICCSAGARKPVDAEPRSATSFSSVLIAATRPATLPITVLPKSL